MDKQEEKLKVVEAENLLQKLIDENFITVQEVQELSKKLQKVNSGAQKKKEENKKALTDFISNKIKIKEYLEQNETHYVILVKAAQKILSKNQQNPDQEKEENKNNQKNSNSMFKLENQNMAEKFNTEGNKYFDERENNLFVYFESLTNDKLESNEMPFYTMAYYPKEKKAYFYFKCSGKINLSFSQVDYLCDSSKRLFLNIDYFSMMENCELEKGREYKSNILDVDKVQKYIEEISSLKENEVKIINLEGNRNEFKKEFCEYCQSLKEKIKGVITNNKDFFNELFL